MTDSLKHLLYVEDDEDIQKIAELALVTMADFECPIVNNGLEALDKLESYTPQLIISDMMMPKMGGLELLQSLKDHHTFSTIPVVFMTAKVAEHEISKYLELGAVGVITKPFNPLELPSQINAIWKTLDE